MLVKLKPEEYIKYNSIILASEDMNIPWYNGGAIYSAKENNEGNIIVVAYSTDIEDESTLLSYYDELNNSSPKLPLPYNPTQLCVLPYCIVFGMGSVGIFK